MSKRNIFYKYCIVPLCKSTTITTPDKLFLAVPRTEKLRKKWCKAMKRDEKNTKALSSSSNRYCCEDHFTLESDLESYMKWKLMGGNLRLKKGVVPHIFNCQRPTEAKPERGAVAKRRHIELINDALTEASIEPLKSMDWADCGSAAVKTDCTASSDSECVSDNSSIDRNDFNNCNMEQRRFSEELLISLVKEHKCLWNKITPQYRNHANRKNSWWEISEHFMEPEVTAKFCKDKFKRLLDARNAAKKGRLVSGLKKKPYKFEYLMGFLGDDDTEETELLKFQDAEDTEVKHTYEVNIQNPLSDAEIVEESSTDWVPEASNHKPSILHVEPAIEKSSKPVFLLTKKMTQPQPRRIAPNYKYVVLGQKRVNRNLNVQKSIPTNGFRNVVGSQNVLVATPNTPNSQSSNAFAVVKKEPTSNEDAHSHFGNTVAAIMRMLPANVSSQLRIKILQLLDEAQNEA